MTTATAISPFSSGTENKLLHSLIFILLVAAHMAIISLIPKFNTYLQSQKSSRSTRLIWLLSPTKPTITPAADKPLPAKARSAHIEAQRNVLTNRTVESAANIVAPSETITVESVAEPVPRMINRDVTQLAKDMDKDLRKDFPNRIPQELIAAKGSFEAFKKNIAAAAKNQELIYQTYTTADGTLITKVTSGLGSYCVSAPNSAGGATIIQREGQGMRVMTCPGQMSF
ncbi:hypothetical protein H8K32_04710 [Undibacterium jejuense]|uniref:Uncharacterized protein n=1 Tax=Undibacterium jejuense TaxID=1344949 RepID=A0A923HGW5_9BURK|nr:hypothetical protein [Undibacterium jejuense]MBC3861392.1 hypothetical protein [Undibacterium jejuense]